MVLEETKLTSLQMMSPSRMKSSLEATQRYLRLDPTSGTTPITIIQMMKNSGLIDHLPQAVLDRAPTEDPPRLTKNEASVQKGQKTLKKEVQGTAASSSGLIPEERARSLFLPTTDETEGVPRERADSQYQGDEGQGDNSSVPSTVDIPRQQCRYGAC